MTVAGTYALTVQSPVGNQDSTMTVVPDANGTTFAGSLVGGMGDVQVADGRIAGNVLTWTMNISSPMPMKLTCEAAIDGDEVSGKVGAGVFGSMPLSGKRLT